MVGFNEFMAKRPLDARYGDISVFPNNGSAAILHMPKDVGVGVYVQAKIIGFDDCVKDGVIIPALFVVPLYRDNGDENNHEGIITDMLVDSSNVSFGELPQTSGIYDAEHGLRYEVVGAGGCHYGDNSLILMKTGCHDYRDFGPNDAHIDELSKHFDEWVLMISES